MNAASRKEARLLAPSLAVALLLAGAAIWLPAWSMVCLTLAALIISLAPFGQEISFGTFSLLLAQPLPRGQTWNIKLSWALGAMLPVWVVTAWTCWPDWDVLWWRLLFSVAILSAGLWTTLLFRQVVAAFWVTLILPLIIGVVPTTALREALLLIYSGAGFAFAWRLFQNAQDIPWTGRAVSWRLEPLVVVTTSRQRGKWGALVGKELRLQHVTWWLIPCLVGVHLLTLFVRFVSPGAEHSTLAGFVWVLWLAAPFVAGAVSVAEERKLGTMQGVLCAPVRRWHQWLLKLILVLAVGFLFGAAAPLLLERLAAGLGIKMQIATPHFLFLSAAAIGVVSFLASSLARNALQAMGIGFVFSVAAVSILTDSTQVFSYSAPYPLPLPSRMLGWSLLLGCLWPAYANFKRIDLDGAWLGSVWRWLLTVGLLVLLAVGIYVRPWELVVASEPAHGPARLSPALPLALRFNIFSIAGLVGNGRIWNCPLTYTKDNAGIPSTNGAEWAPGTNWVDIALFRSSIFALRGDGTLWQLWKSNDGWQNSQIGSENDWTSIAQAGFGIAGTRSDGSLWHWLPRAAPNRAVPSHAGRMVRLGKWENWAQLLQSQSYGYVGVAQDGKVYTFNLDINSALSGHRSDSLAFAGEPTRLPFQGTDWEAVTDFGALDREGIFWTSVTNWRSLQTRGGSSIHPVGRGPVEPHPGWRSLTSGFNSLAEISDDGVLAFQSTDLQRLSQVHGYFYRLYPFSLADWECPFCQPSRYTDWLQTTAYNNAVAALAADGTLTCWRIPNSYEGQYSLLGPPRGAAWSINIFAHPPDGQQF